MVFICKKCKKAFRKDMSTYEESDEYCPHCDNHYVCDIRAIRASRLTLGKVIEAKTPKPIIGVEGEDARIDSRFVDCHILWVAAAEVEPGCSKTTESRPSMPGQRSLTWMTMSLRID